MWYLTWVSLWDPNSKIPSSVLQETGTWKMKRENINDGRKEKNENRKDAQRKVKGSLLRERGKSGFSILCIKVQVIYIKSWHCLEMNLYLLTISMRSFSQLMEVIERIRTNYKIEGLVNLRYELIEHTTFHLYAGF